MKVKQILAALLVIAMLPTLGAFALENDASQDTGSQRNAVFSLREDTVLTDEDYELLEIQTAEHHPTDVKEGGFYTGDFDPSITDPEAWMREWLAEHPEEANAPVDVDESEFYRQEELRQASAQYSEDAPSEPLRSGNADYYLQSTYYTELQNALSNDTGNQKDLIIAIARSQYEYHEGDSVADLGGHSNGTHNYTEYGRSFDENESKINSDWCAMFINWCARQAGISESVIAHSSDAGTTGLGTFVPYNNGINIKTGDIVCFENGTHVELVTGVDANYVYTIGGNTSTYNVMTHKLERISGGSSSWHITHYFSPNYYIPSGWAHVGNYWYYHENGIAQTGWKTINGYTYYLDPAYNGRMVTGWQTISNHTYYFAENGHMATGWQLIGDYYYYFSASGIMYTGWLTFDGFKYYLWTDNGIMATGLCQIGDDWYYFRKPNDSGPTGAQCTGWVVVDSPFFYEPYPFYFDPNDSGKALLGWNYLDGHWYYFTDTYTFAGALWVEWLELPNNNGGYDTYYLSPDIGPYGGGMVTGWQEIDSCWYYFSEQVGGPLGAMQKGWFTKPDTGSTYYFDPTTGVMQTGWQAIDGHWYYFTDPNGYMQKGWLNLNGTYYYLDPSSGQMQTGWLNLDGTYYYLDLSSGQMQTGWQTIEGHRYYMESTGEACTGWKKIDNEWYYFYETPGGPKCAMKTGWHWDGNYWYYLTPSTGVMHTGWQQLNGNWYYLCTTTERDLGYGPLGSMLIGTYTINGVSYTFDSNGILQS